MGKGSVEVKFDYFCTKRGIASTTVMGLSLVLFMFLLLLNNFSGVYMWLQYMSFTYSLMGFFLAIHSVFSSNDSSTTVFSTLYYGVGAISFLAGGFTAISKGSEGFLGTVVGTISVGLGAFMIIFTVWGSQI